jgi:hypothetical protein
MLSWTSNALFRAATNNPEAAIRTYYVAMPTLCYFPAVPEDAIGWQLFLVPFIVSFLLPPFAAMLTAEKSQRLYHGMTVKGLTSRLYWVGNWLYAVVLFSCLGFSYTGLAYAMEIKSFTNCGWSLLSILVLLWAHAQGCLSFFLAGFVSDARSASVVAYLLLFVGAIAGGVINRPDQGFEPYPWQLLLLPNFAYSRALARCLLYGGDFVNSDLAQAFWYLFGSSSVLGVLGIYAHRVQSSAQGSGGRSLLPHFCHLPTLAALRCAASNNHLRKGSSENTGNQQQPQFDGKEVDLDVEDGRLGGGSSGGGGASRQHGVELVSSPSDREASGRRGRGGAQSRGGGWSDNNFDGSSSSSSSSSSSHTPPPSDDVLVLQAEQHVRSGAAAMSEHTCILLEKFVRVYPSKSGAPAKVAVGGVDLAIDYGECFGLLG